jgi:hypothetical protein
MNDIDEDEHDQLFVAYDVDLSSSLPDNNINNNSNKLEVKDAQKVEISKEPTVNLPFNVKEKAN